MAKNKNNYYKAKTRIFSILHNRIFETGEVIEYPNSLEKTLKPLIDQGILEPAQELENEHGTESENLPQL